MLQLCKIRHQTQLTRSSRKLVHHATPSSLIALRSAPYSSSGPHSTLISCSRKTSPSQSLKQSSLALAQQNFRSFAAKSSSSLARHSSPAVTPLVSFTHASTYRHIHSDLAHTKSTQINSASKTNRGVTLTSNRQSTFFSSPSSFSLNNHSLANHAQKRHAASDAKGQVLEEIYQKKTQVEHVLDRPDSYIGSIEHKQAQMWVLHVDKKKKPKSSPPLESLSEEREDLPPPKMVLKDVVYVPGLLKIFDEILVNAVDNKARHPTKMTELRVDIDPETGWITVWNNGPGIPIHHHKKEEIYIPEMVFGHLLTGSNFDDKLAKITGGRNGYGAKLTNIFSTEFEIETGSASSKEVYSQKWSNNMSMCSPHKIAKKPTPDFTKVAFRPDFAKFGLKELSETDTLALMKKRVYDVAGTLNSKLKVFLNGTQLHFKNTEEYWKMYQEDDVFPIVTHSLNARWEIGVTLAPASVGLFTQVSFVNGINTRRGGSHTYFLADLLVKGLEKNLQKKDKIFSELNPVHIRNRLFIFVNCLIENPSFDSQTKETLTTKPSNFSSGLSLPDKFINSVINNTGLLELLEESVQRKRRSELSKATNAQATRNQNKLIGIPKLYDANHAGTKRSAECTLILTEGDSAKAMAVTGLSEIGRDFYGVFPLRGKPLNVRDAPFKKLLENAEIQQVATILGLNFNKTTPNATRFLRYGKVMIMTDQDHDGSHIKGLLINLFEQFWPHLLEDPNFLSAFITPIVKVSKNKVTHSFYSMAEYREWERKTAERDWNVKYYKGLGTSTSAEAKEYFRNLNKNRIQFHWTPDSAQSLELAFGKDKSNERKEWLQTFDENVHPDYRQTSITYPEFIDQELKAFSFNDNIRSIPSAIDGLKPAQRKILMTALSKNVTHEVKVTQLAGQVTEKTAYHHGEASLHSTITKMAQNFVGSNNIPLLYPAGQFGTRFQLGKDAASARYIFTRLGSCTRSIFLPEDDAILEYTWEDGIQVEPRYFAPVIPMVLVNGALGLGTGWSTSIPMFNPADLIENLEYLLDGRTPKKLTPWLRGFRGSIHEHAEPNTWEVEGVYEAHLRKKIPTITISELPPAMSYDAYKEFLDSEVKNANIVDYRMNHHSDGNVTFTVYPNRDSKDPELSHTQLLTQFRLKQKVFGTNMHLFNSQGLLKHFATPQEIINEFYEVRLSLYEKRKQHQLKVGAAVVEKLSNQFEFCAKVISQELPLANTPRAQIVGRLEERGFAKINGSYDYILSLPLWQLSEERMSKLKTEKQKEETALRSLQTTPPKELWRNDLSKLQDKLRTSKEF